MPRHRVLVIAFLLLVPFLAVEARLVYLQGFRAEGYRDEILRKRTGIQLLPLWRGRILDRNGNVLALDQRGFDVQIRVGDFQKIPEARERLYQLLPDRRGEIDARLSALQARIEEKLIGLPLREANRLRREESHLAFPFLEGIPFQAALMIESHPEQLPGLDVQERLRRRYPFGTLAAHVVGYVGKITKEEYEKLLEKEFFREELGESVEETEYDLLRRRGLFLEEIMGRAGIERKFHAALRGKRGAILRERDTRSGEVSDTAATDARPGRDVRLTLDREAQARAEKALEGKRGAIVAMDVETGEVLALASAPTFDPNDFAPPPNNEAIRRLSAPDAGHPLQNRAVASAYPPGSVFKILTASAALQEGKIDPGSSIECDVAITLGTGPTSHPFRCWIFEHGHGHGSQEVTGALQRSCNIFFYNCGRRLGVNLFHRWMAAFGLGEPSGIELSPESRGIIPKPIPEGRTNPVAESIMLGIGQGNLAISPLQAARVTAAIANGGRLVRPRLVLQDGEDPEPPARDLGIRKEFLELVRRGMWKVVNEEGGTGLKSGMSRFKAGGKTGTAQAGGGKPNHAWFVCFFPHEKPRYAICVFVEHGGKGSEAAAPLSVPVAEALERLVDRSAPAEPAPRPPRTPAGKETEPPPSD